MITPENASILIKTALDKIARLKDSDANEASTRLQVVDDVLMALGWQKNEFFPEQPTGANNYTDYLLKLNNVPYLVVEAKRVGKSFTLPNTVHKKEYTAKFLVTNCGPELKEAMTQAAQYCNETSAPYAAVTNGEQWIIFRGLASTKGWIEHKAFVFSSSEMLQREFASFWNLLSKECVLKGSLPEKIGQFSTKPPTFAKRPNSETESPIIPNKISAKDVDTLFDYYFDEILTRDSGSMLRECYVEDQEVKEYNRELQSLLKDRLLPLGEEVETEELDADNFMSAIEAPLPDQRAKVVLLVGHVGAGKSTFIRRYFTDLEDQGYAKFIFDVLNEGNPTGVLRNNETEILSTYILEKISDYYHQKPGYGQEYDPYNHDTLRTMFGGLIRRMKEGPNRENYKEDSKLFERDLAAELTQASKNSENLLPLYLKYVYKRRKPNKPFCLIFDNVDRASDRYQEFIYNFAHILSKGISGIIIISMRETTYFRAKQKGFLDTRASDKVFQLNAPNLKNVISKRLKYLSYQIEGQKPAPRAIKDILPNLEPIAEHLKNILLREDNSAREMITSLSNRSVRKAFSLLRNYAMSPFAWEELKDVNAGQRVLMALMLSDFKYESSKSQIINLFAVPPYNQISHFIPLKILAFLYWKYQQNGSFKESPSISDLLVTLESFRVPKSQGKDALVALIKSELVECDNWYNTEQLGTRHFESDDPEPSEDFHIRITAAGYYYLKTLSNDAVYLGLCSQDTFWFSETYYTEYIEEFQSFIEVVSEEPKLDYFSSTKCREIWLAYLGEQRFIEESKLGDSIDKSWWEIAFRSIKSVQLQDKSSIKGSKDSASRTRKLHKASLWEEGE